MDRCRALRWRIRPTRMSIMWLASWETTMKTVAIICARIGSTRLPYKVLRCLNGEAVLNHIMKRARGLIGCNVAVAFPETEYDILAPIMHDADMPYTAGSENDVLGRMIETARFHEADIISVSYTHLTLPTTPYV